MKKILLALSLLVMTVTAQAQLHLGVTAGLNSVNNNIKSVEKETVLDKNNYTGYYFGPMLQLGLGGFAVDASALYSQKGLELPNEETYKNNVISVPVNLKTYIGLGKLLSVYAGAGPQFDFSIGNLKPVQIKEADTYKEYVMNKSAISANVCVGVALFQHLQVEARYNWELTESGVYKLLDSDKSGAISDVIRGEQSFKNRTLHFSATYIF